MMKMVKRLALCMLAAVFFWCGTLLADRQKLGRELIRMHVVAASDSEEDQYLKLRIRDAVTDSLSRDLKNIADVEQAEQYLREKLPCIQRVAKTTMESLGCEDDVTVQLCREAFDTRIYDTFTLPAGVYKSLRIMIGQAQGKNWWCVVFPEFCMPDGYDDVTDVAAGAGFDDSLTGAITGETGYELRFGILDVMGKLENLLFEG